jgi:hypothetical protein
MYDVDEINYQHPYDRFMENGEWVEGENPDLCYFYVGDYNEDDALFRWYGKDYFYSEEMQNQNKEMIDEWVEKSPMLEFDNDGKKEQLDNLFGDRWHQPFKDWFQDNFDLPVKTIE